MRSDWHTRCMLGVVGMSAPARKNVDSTPPHVWHLKTTSSSLREEEASICSLGAWLMIAHDPDKHVASVASTS
ncbi:hypothetical protein FIBSPDRAFT_851193, partial [Athelia psychrophila]